MKKDYAEYLLKKTTEDYNLIARDFSRTRRFIWEDIKPLSDFTVTGEKVLDIGCGNGRLLQIFQDIDIDYTGIDASKELIAEAQKYYPNARFHVYDALRMPLPTNYFDKVYAIAVLHHIPSQELRIRFLKEAKRVLRQEGLLILTVWNLWNWQGLGLILKHLFLKITGKSKLDFKDVFIPWAGTCQRYIHVFSKGELEHLVEDAGFKVKEIGVLGANNKKNKNFYIVAEDISP
ncbi:MAG: class I SAM-dependent methyltransferase [Candidatus Nealsonbacteria bacterium]|nr:class I SAM-dependent methyltransferase [Candidatus Nealsonbacteria bacterium]